MFDSKALTKIQSIVLVAVIVVASVSGVIAYVLLGDQGQSDETIKIGLSADIDNYTGKGIWQGMILAAEQVNAEGGILGRDFEIITEDNDGETPPYDVTIATNALTKLMTVDNADFVYWSGSFSNLMAQDSASQHKKILFGDIGSASDEATQRVLDDYENYKYYFKIGTNSTINILATVQSFLDCREYTGFNKVAFVYNTIYGVGTFIETVVEELAKYDFELVHTALIPANTIDFSSYFAQAEASGAEILYPFIAGSAGVPFVKEYYDRQSPMVLWGMVLMAQQNDFWEVTGGKCEHMTNNGFPIVAGYPFTNKTLATQEAYIERWDEEITMSASRAYDIVRFMLPTAIKLAGTTETDAVIEALETIEIETSNIRQLKFAPNHQYLYKTIGSGSVCMFQWQDGVQMPVWPKYIMEEEGVTYTFPNWPGPWDDQQTG